MVKQIVRLSVFVAVILFGQSFAVADEGMWLLNNLPLAQLKEKYNFVPTAEWVEKVQKSSARLPNCSSSFVSGDGLIMTNGHCAEEAVMALSTPTRNYYRDGFYAFTYAHELKTDRTLKVLMNINSKGVAQPGLECEEVSLYQGAQYQNYCYKVYNDIRLVFSSEKNTWFFGGDADNFEYPRYALDVAFLRAYENGKPAKTPFHFKWSKSGPKDGELIFVSGHPGRTARLLTSSALATERDVRVPFILDLSRRRELTTQQFMLKGKEQRRIAESDLFSWQNTRKLYVGKLRGLQDPELMEAKKASERRFFSDSYSNIPAADKYANGLIMIGDAQNEIRNNYVKYMLLARGFGFDSRLYDYARSIVSGDSGFMQAVLEARTKEPRLNLEYEEAKLTDSLTHLVEVFGADDPLFVELLAPFGGSPSSPSRVANRLIYGSALLGLNEHRRMVLGVDGNLQQSNDPMINLALLVKLKSEVYKNAYDKALKDERSGYAQLSEALFQVYGTNRYPDATFTLRLSFGTMSGYTENGRIIPPFTTIGGMYDHSTEFGDTGDYKFPALWWMRKRFVNLRTPLNFISNLDITGGNSGSPVFNKDLEIVGLVFDGNIHSLVSDYDYNYSSESRAVSVHSSAILEVLSKIYRADRLVKELNRR
ncbi:MAG: S46 family peptidase [Candidatus Yanofskybacteria bacterium]|nr:S46 family peptidase [Candidatus Yanofskybacteria bacterium]